ncbi:MAG TPA: polyhydroxyalkanoate synthesis regulator DNA-binding domain-containing protein [bacterium]|nr:polyhydroxyalkanoate synthesis regulator DNA-binding domain-containing protein [bacterium]
MKETIIKRYQNRKLYDTAASRYVTLEDIAQMVKRGEEVRILDNRTKKDLTAVTLAQILYEEEKSERSLLPLATLKKIVQNRGEVLIDAVAKGRAAIEKGLTGVTESVTEKAAEVGSNISDIQAKLETRMNSLKDSVNVARDLKNEITRLEEKIKVLEKRVKELE